MEFTDVTIGSIFSGFENQRLVLPNFQRGFVWNRSKQQGLVASALVDLPVGSLLILDGHTEDFAKRPLCKHQEIDLNKGPCEYVLDGQQRLSTLRAVFTDVFSENDWAEVWESLYRDLRARWFLKIFDKEDGSDIFESKYLGQVNFRSFTDTEVIGHIEFKLIRKTKVDEPHHPKFLASNRRDAVRYFAEHELIPLWEISEKDQGLHENVLRRIADNRVTELKERLKEGGYELEAYEEVFQNYNSGGDTAKDLYEEIEVDGEGENRELKLSTPLTKLSERWVNHLKNHLEGLLERRLAITQIQRDEIGRAVAIFEAINKGGQPLTTYDLLVAKSSPGLDSASLSTRIKDIVNAEMEIPRFVSNRYFDSKAGEGHEYALWSASKMGVFDDNEPSSQFKDWFINVLSLLVHVDKYGLEPSTQIMKRDKILSMSTSDISENYGLAVKAIIRSLAFLQLRCGVIEARNLPYNLMLVVIAFFFSKDEIWKSDKAHSRIEQWYWLSLFSGEYSKSQNDRAIQDIRQRLRLFIESKDVHSENVFDSLLNNVLSYDGYATEDILLRKDDVTGIEPKSVQSAILQFILSKNIPDFVSGGGFRSLSAWDVANGDLKLHKHHIIPLGAVSSIGESSSVIRADKKHILNSPLNLIYISDEANRAISDDPIESYLPKIENFSGTLGGIPDIKTVKEAVQNGTQEGYAEVLRGRYNRIRERVIDRVRSL